MRGVSYPFVGLTLASKARQTDYVFFREVEPRGTNDGRRAPRGSFGLCGLILSPIPGGRRGPLVAPLARFCSAACSKIAALGTVGTFRNAVSRWPEGVPPSGGVTGAGYRMQLHHTAISDVKRESRQRLKSALMVSSSS
jgi:hypothetical protein